MPMRLPSDSYLSLPARLTFAQSYTRRVISSHNPSAYRYHSVVSSAHPSIACKVLSSMDKAAGLGSSHVDHAVQQLQETTLESDGRKAADFHEFEQEKLNFQRFSIEEFNLIDKVTGLLGSKNPFGKKAKADEHEIWLLNNTAYRPTAPNADNSEWEAEFVACYFYKGRKDITKFVSRIADAIGLDGKAGSDEDVRKMIAKRLQPFISPIAPARTVEILIPSRSGASVKHQLGPSDANGISSQVMKTGGDGTADGTTITYGIDGTQYPQASGDIRFAGEEGWAIISDIDDTIKVTQTFSPLGILQTTFAEEPKTTEGMPEFYKVLDDQFQKPAWFYLSASPYNLYPFLHQFVNDNYKPGTLILRDSSWMYFGGILQSLTQGTQAYKTDRMKKIHGWLPKRKFICIGDSTQTDPESYAQMYKTYPGWVKAIYIRKVLDAAHMQEKNEEERFTKAFEGIPSHVWKVFVNPDELDVHVKTLMEEAQTGTEGAPLGL